MDTAEIIQNGGLVIGGGLITKAFDFATAWWKSRQTVKVEQPLEVAKKHDFVTVGECNRRMCEFAQRIDSTDKKLDNFTAAIEDLDQKDEQRIVKLNERVDTLVSKVSEVAGKMDIVKDAFIKTSIGGKK